MCWQSGRCIPLWDPQGKGFEKHPSARRAGTTNATVWVGEPDRTACRGRSVDCSWGRTAAGYAGLDFRAARVLGNTCESRIPERRAFAFQCRKGECRGLAVGHERRGVSPHPGSMDPLALRCRRVLLFSGSLLAPLPIQKFAARPLADSKVRCSLSCKFKSSLLALLQIQKFAARSLANSKVRCSLSCQFQSSLLALWSISKVRYSLSCATISPSSCSAKRSRKRSNKRV